MMLYWRSWAKHQSRVKKHLTYFIQLFFGLVAGFGSINSQHLKFHHLALLNLKDCLYIVQLKTAISY